MDRDKGIGSREQVDNNRRSSTLGLFHFSDFPPDGRADEKQSHHAKSVWIPRRFGLKMVGYLLVDTHNKQDHNKNMYEIQKWTAEEQEGSIGHLLFTV